jgi:hypothetical protein
MPCNCQAAFPRCFSKCAFCHICFLGLTMQQLNNTPCATTHQQQATNTTMHIWGLNSCQYFWWSIRSCGDMYVWAVNKGRLCNWRRDKGKVRASDVALWDAAPTPSCSGNSHDILPLRHCHMLSHNSYQQSHPQCWASRAVDLQGGCWGHPMWCI